jgi:hypothetical protein
LERRGRKAVSVDELRDRKVAFHVNERDLALLSAVQVLRGGDASKGATLRALLREEHERLEANPRLRTEGERKRVPHGTFSGYSYHACRCVDCREAWNSYQREYRNKRRLARLEQAGVADGLPTED